MVIVVTDSNILNDQHYYHDYLYANTQAYSIQGSYIMNQDILQYMKTHTILQLQPALLYIVWLHT